MPPRKKTVHDDDEGEPVAATDPQTTPAPETTVAEDGVSEYELPDGGTYLLTAKDAEARGGKAVKPSNKAVTPSNK